MHLRSVWLTACSATLAAALAGCGESDQEAQRQAVGPRIESTLANGLADTSEEIATQLEAEEFCGASDAAARLRADLTEAINAGAVPEAYLEELSGLVNEIEAEIPACEPAPPPADDEDDDGKKKPKKDKKDREDRDDEDDDDDPPADTDTFPTTTETVPTTTETATTETTTTDTTTTTTTTTTEGE
ncbi:MAG TPA: hypothetical protein VH968_14605 [Gaiellaceae bacterium]|jgi:hypothetical protein